MEYRQFGNSDLNVSIIGFGAWGIGGPAMVGTTPIGWGDVDDRTSKLALLKARERGINFFDTADFYGLGHSESLIGEVFGNSDDVIVATKVGHRPTEDGKIVLDYSKKHILSACEKSLRRLQRDAIDFYQLHSARMNHFEQGECIEVMEQLRKDGKIRYWGLSLNSFHPFEESEFMMERKLGNGFQLVFNIINQRALSVIQKASQQGHGIIARMPLQFGLLTGKFSSTTIFLSNDHRSFRLTEKILKASLNSLNEVWKIAEERNISKTSLALSFCKSIPGISTIIPGIKTPDQAISNTNDILTLTEKEMNSIFTLFKSSLSDVVLMMEKQG